MSFNNEKELVNNKDELRDVCEYVDLKNNHKEAKQTLNALKDTMLKNDLVALSAPQIGIKQRIFCVKDKKGIHGFVNPMLQKATEITFSREKDECFPDEEYIYPRSGRIEVAYQDPDTCLNCAKSLVGYNAFIFQRMLDHLNGALVSDIGLEVDELWDQASEEERAEVLQAYAESLKLLQEKLNEDIKNDEELNKQMKAVEFEQALMRGEVSLEEQNLTDEQRELLDQKFAKMKESAELENKETDKEN